MAHEVLEVLRRAVVAVSGALAGQLDWGPTGQGHGQYRHDVVADAAATGVLTEAGFGVFSEESGVSGAGSDILVVVDPVDGSTNASRGLPWWAVSLCALDGSGPLAAVVACPPGGLCFEAVRDGGATCNGSPAEPGGAARLSEAVVAFNGWPSSHYGWAQYRAFGAASLDLCAVACGMVDGFVDCSRAGLAPWDYMGALLVCSEAGAIVEEIEGRPLVLRRPGERRSLVAAANRQLLDQLLAARRGVARPEHRP